MGKNNESISEQLGAVCKWLYDNREAIKDAGHEIMFADVAPQPDNMVSNTVICGVEDSQLAYLIYHILKYRFEASNDHALLKVYFMQFIRNLQSCYELDYADTDNETVEQAVKMMQTAVEEHAEKFHELFDDDDDPELADSVNKALHTFSEIRDFFDLPDSVDFEDLEFIIDDDDDDDEEDEDDDE